MTPIRYKTKITKDRGVSVPRKAREQLNLQPGDDVEVTLQKPIVSAPRMMTRHPLTPIIGIGKGGPRDRSESHDSTLNAKQSLTLLKALDDLGDAAEQLQTFTYLKAAIDTDRLSDRKRFG